MHEQGVIISLHLRYHDHAAAQQAHVVRLEVPVVQEGMAQVVDQARRSTVHF
jgi:hypothetical protein